MNKYYHLSLAILILCNCFSFHLCQFGSFMKGVKFDSEIEQSFAGSRNRPTNEILDELFARTFPVFNGLPDNIGAIGIYCASFIPFGIAVLAFTTARYPHKLLVKAIIAVSAIGYLKQSGNICLNPLNQLDYITKGKQVNEELAGIRDIHKEITIRFVNVGRKFSNPEDYQKHCCCAYAYGKQAVIDLLGRELGRWYLSILDGYFLLGETVFCQQYTQARYDELCSDIDWEPLDKKPKIDIPRHVITAAIDVFLNFI